MAQRDPSLPVRSEDLGREERRRLDRALDAAAVATGDLDAARSVLLDRLFSHSDDFAATTALQALNAVVAGERQDARSDAPARLRDAGRSSWQRLGHRHTRGVA
jgi:hypothetical protein